MGDKVTIETVKDLHIACNRLHHRKGIPVMDVNAHLLGMVTSSLQNQLGSVRARDYIESAMDRVWGKKPKKKWWQK